MEKVIITLQEALDKANEVSIMTEESSLPLYEKKEIDNDEKKALALIFYSELDEGPYSEIIIEVDTDQIIDLHETESYTSIKDTSGETHHLFFKVVRPLTQYDFI